MSKPKPLKSQPVVPTLELISGEQVSRVFEVKGADLHIGRTRGSECQLDDSKVSRNHARVERRSDGSCYLVDLDSQNNSYVDGQKLTPYQAFKLRDGCRIKIVDFELIFRAPALGLRNDEGERSTVLGSIDDLSSIRLARRLKQPAEAFKAILDVIQALGGTDLDEKLGRALDGLMAVFPRAERGFILTVEPDGALPLRAVRHRGGPGDAPSLSRTIARQVLEEAKAVLISDATIDEDYKGQQSIASSLRTALVVPLAGSDGKPVGMIQLDSRGGQGGVLRPQNLTCWRRWRCPWVLPWKTTRCSGRRRPGQRPVRSSVLFCRSDDPTSLDTLSGSVTDRSRRLVETFMTMFRVGLDPRRRDRGEAAARGGDRRRRRGARHAGRFDDGGNLSIGPPSCPRRGRAGRGPYEGKPRGMGS